MPGFNARNRSTKNQVSSAGFNLELAPLHLGVCEPRASGDRSADLSRIKSFTMTQKFILRLPIANIIVGIGCTPIKFPPSMANLTATRAKSVVNSTNTASEVPRRGK